MSNSTPLHVNDSFPWNDIETLVSQAANYVEPTDDLRPKLLEAAQQRVLSERTLGSALFMSVCAAMLALCITGQVISPAPLSNLPELLLSATPISLRDLGRITEEDFLAAWSVRLPGESRSESESAWQAVRMMTQLRIARREILRNAFLLPMTDVQE